MTQPLKHDRYGRPITRYELPLLEPARQRSSRFMPELDANNRPCVACPKCNGGSSGGFPTQRPFGYCIDCTPVNKGPVLMFIGKVGR